MFDTSKIFHCNIIQMLWIIIRSIFTVPYVTHKGIRRLAFILGCLNGLFALYIIIQIGNVNNYEYFPLLVAIISLTDFLWGWYLFLLIFALLKLLYKLTKWFISSFSNKPIFNQLKSILLVKYVKNIGIRRICITLGGFFSLLLLFYILLQEGVRSFLHNTNFVCLSVCMLILFYIPFIFVSIFKWIIEGFQESKKYRRKSRK